MELKDFVGLCTLALSGLAAWSAYEARLATENLASRKFDTELTVKLLADVHGEMRNGLAGVSNSQSCVFVETLLLAETKAEAKEPRLVRQFVERLREAGEWSGSCQLKLDEVIGAAETPTPDLAVPATQPKSAVTLDTSTPGQWHAVIASYPVSESGCANARDDIPEFANLLLGAAPSKARLAVVQTFVSNHFAVTVDLGSDRIKAMQMVDAIRAVAPQSADHRTGADAFLQETRNWQFPADCTALHIF